MKTQAMYKIVLFGTGCKCLDFRKIIDHDNVEIVAYIDNEASLHGQLFYDRKIIAPSEICQYDYDYVVVVNRFFAEVAAQLESLGVARDKVVGPYIDSSELLDKHIAIVDKLVREKFAPPIGKAPNLIARHAGGDYVRQASLELVAKEIYESGVLGSVAELGVYRGDFAKLINQQFPDRKLYLFDTFDGFNNDDVAIEQQKKFSDSEVSHFANTSAEVVLSKMPYPEQCLVRQGYFPATTAGLEDQFAFVSIDADLYQPIYAGLQFFYPRMAKGGYIFLHDFNNQRFKGAKEATKRYCAEKSISYFPLSDICGTAVIIK